MIGNSSVIEFKTEKIYYMGDKSIQYLCTVKSPVPQKYEVEITKRFEFGDCLLYRASGSLTPLNGSPVGLEASNFIYYTDKSSPDYGLLKEEVKTNGLTIHNQYDYKGRLSIRTETCNNFKKITHNIYCNVEFNDRRIARTREFLEINGLRRYMAETQYIYENTPALVRHTVKRRTELNREPDVSFTEWYGWDSNSNGSYSPFAIGRLKCERNSDGKETFYRYNTSSEDGIAYTCYQTERYKGLPFPHSKQTVLSYNMRGEIAKKQEYIHL